MGKTSKVVVVRGKDPARMVPKGLDELGIEVRGRKIVIKPNLITDRAYPVTTPLETVKGFELVLRLVKNFAT